MLNRRPLLALPALALAPRGARAQDPVASRFLGSPEARATVLDFSSMTCPHCAAFALGPFSDIRARFVATGAVRWVFHEFPLDGVALLASKVLRRIPPERYYATRRFLFSEQRAWASSPGALVGLLQGAGVGEDDLVRIAEDEALSREVMRERAWAEATYAVSATPTFVLHRQGMPGHSARRGRIDAEAVGAWLSGG